MCFLYEKRKSTGLRTQIGVDKAYAFLDEMFSLSPFLKSVVMGGPGEPLEYSHFEDIISYFSKNGLAIHIYSSGNARIKKYVESIVDNVTLFRVSLDASNAETYVKTHGKKDFKNRLEYLKVLISKRDSRKSEMLIGVHFVIQKHNFGEILDFAKLVNSIGVDCVEYVWESYYVVNGMDDSEVIEATELLESVEKMRAESFSVISPLARVKHQLTEETSRLLTAEQVEKHCQDLTGRLNFTVNGNVSLCAQERFETESVFDLGDATPEIARKLRFGIDNGFTDFLPNGKFEVGCATCFCNNYNRTMNVMARFIEKHEDAHARLISGNEH